VGEVSVGLWLVWMVIFFWGGGGVGWLDVISGNQVIVRRT
jgi:hypothetical protein